MDRGFTAVRPSWPRRRQRTPGQAARDAGSTLISTVGGASGPLWGTACGAPASRSATPTTIEPEALADALEAAVDGVVELGAAQPGDKTMVDALRPAVDALRGSLDSGADITGGRRGQCGGRRGHARDHPDAGPQGPGVVSG